jgi:erythromycin esterase
VTSCLTNLRVAARVLRRTAFVNDISRRGVLKAGGACLGMTLIPSKIRGQAPDRDRLQHWIEQNAVLINPDPVSGEIDGAAEQLIAALGDARIVMLGEPSHGAGSAFAAKVRLIELLHDRLGFDVLVWESGLIDLQRTEAGLRGDLDPVEAAQRGILKIWSASAECKPLFAYVKASYRGARPLTMAGFDMQLTAPGTYEYFSGELRAFVRTLARMQNQAAPLAEDVLNHFARLNRYAEALAEKAAEIQRAGVTGAAHSTAIRDWEQSEGEKLRPVADDLDRLQRSTAALERLLRQSRDHAVPTPAAGGEGFMIHAIASLAAYGANLFEAYGKHSAEAAARYAVTGENRRDQVNADNLKWLIETAYAGKKIIVWAHNAHVMDAWYGKKFDSVSLEPLTDGMKPTGVWLTGWYGDALYKIGFTAYQGSDGWVGTPPVPVPPAPRNSFEDRLHRLGAPEVFVPLRGSRALRSVSAPLSMRIPKYKFETVADPARAFDALYFIDTMKPATSV